MGYAISIFTSKLRDPPAKLPLSPNNINKPPTKIKNSDLPPAKTSLKFLNTPLPLPGTPQARGGVHAMFYVLWTQKSFSMYKKMKRTEELVGGDPKIFMSLSEPGLVGKGVTLWIGRIQFILQYPKVIMRFLVIFRLNQKSKVLINIGLVRLPPQQWPKIGLWGSQVAVKKTSFGVSFESSYVFISFFNN